MHLEIDCTTFVSVECPKDVLTKLLCISSREEHLVHLTESVRSELSVGAVLG